MNLISLESLILVTTTFITYYLIGFINKKCNARIPQWIVLLISSLIFYGLIHYIYLIYIVSMSFLVYCGTRYISNEKNIKNKRFISPKFVSIFLIVSIICVLFVLKYINFFTSIINSSFKTKIPIFNFIIPLGISFYSFSLISYVVDVKRSEIKAEHNILKFMLYVCYFPKLLQGPISSFKNMKENGLYDDHYFENSDYIKSLFRISVGLIKKLAIANILNLYVNQIYKNINNSSSLVLILGSILYTAQIFCDFSGYMDIVIGISRLFGINLEENFENPYLSLSIQDFWRKWHITLGEFLKKYIYIPLGGSRVNLFRWILNILIVWIISGLWHGANLTFVIWGLFNGVLIILEGLCKKYFKFRFNNNFSINKYIRYIAVFSIINFGWIIFRSPSISVLILYTTKIFQIWLPGTYNPFMDTSLAKANMFLILAIVLIILLIGFSFLKFKIKNKIKLINNDKFKFVFNFSFIVIAFSFSIYMFLRGNSIAGVNDSFIYFNF